MKNYILFVFLLLPFQAFAGVSELSFSFSKSQSQINEFNLTKRDFITGSYSYYIGSSSAIEFSYTSGRYENSSGTDVSNVNEILGIFEFYGIDVVLGFTDRSAPFQPFIKFGAVYLDKKFYLNPTNDLTLPTSSQCGIAPSAGAGFKYRLTKTFSLRFNIDGSTQPLGNDCEGSSSDVSLNAIDYAAKTGISWFF